MPKLHESTPAVIEQEPAFAPPRFQVPLGRVSETVTLVESPVPPAVTTRVKVARSEERRVGKEGRRRGTLGQLTVNEGGPALADPSLPVATVALLLTVPHDASVVCEER